MYEYLWIWWTGKSQCDFHRDENNLPKYMTEEEAKSAYDNLFKVEATRRPKDFTLNNECCINCEFCDTSMMLLSDPPQYPLNCGILSTVYTNDFKQKCTANFKLKTVKR